MCTLLIEEGGGGGGLRRGRHVGMEISDDEVVNLPCAWTLPMSWLRFHPEGIPRTHLRYSHRCPPPTPAVLVSPQACICFMRTTQVCVFYVYTPPNPQPFVYTTQSSLATTITAVLILFFLPPRPPPPPVAILLPWSATAPLCHHRARAQTIGRALPLMPAS